MEEEFDSGDENVAAVDHFGSGSNDAGLEPESGLAAVRNEESRLDLKLFEQVVSNLPKDK